MFSKLTLKTTTPIINHVRSHHHIMKKRLEGKIAVVTASTDGIGFEIAKRLAQEGADVIVSSRKQQNVDSAVAKLLSEGLKVKGIVCHVANAVDRKRIFDEADKMGGLDILVSNAAANPYAGITLECPESTWDKIFEVNVKASFLLAKEAYPLFRKRGGGSLIFISSIAGYNPFSLLGPYSVSKTALLGLTKVLSKELASEDIRVNCVAPGVVKTKFASYITSNEDMTDFLTSQIPMKRFGTTDDISGVVAFLASYDAKYVTGETIVVSGGLHSRI